MKFDLQNKVVLVTGASRGIGRAIALQFSQIGARVAVHYHKNRDAAEKTLSDLKGENHILCQADMSDANSVRQMTESVISKMNRIDILVNNAGVYDEHRIPEVSYEEWQNFWEKMIQTNLIGPANLSFLVAKEMIKNSGGRIINISSRGAFRGEPFAFAYGASKAGMNSMGQSMAKALAPHNIFVYTIAPGFVETDMISGMMESPQGKEYLAQSPLNRAARPEEIADTAIHLATGDTEYMTGCIIDINGASYLRS
jgi:3-oxoacyl-[acyl-carrier protein] reductase